MGGRCARVPALLRPIGKAGDCAPVDRENSMKPTNFDFAALLAPIDERQFWEEHYGRKPLHISQADGGGTSAAKAGLMSFAGLDALLAEPARWTQDTIKLVLNGRGVDPAHFKVTREFSQGESSRPDPALIQTLMMAGATVVIDGMEDQVTELRQICGAIGQTFGAKVSVNLYASRRGMQGFSSHCDPHEVFAVHCEGEKVWRIYENIEDRPVEATLIRNGDYIERKKGRIVSQITMLPGDLLYIPRGFYHDALASSERSLHLTFGVQPLYGIAVLDLVREMALSEPAMREYLSPASDSDALRKQIGDIAQTLAALVETPGMLEDIAVRQRTLAFSAPPSSDSAPTEYFVRTSLPCMIDQPLSGSVLTLGSQQFPAGLLSDAARWAIGQKSFSWPQFEARFCHHPSRELKAFLEEAVKQGAFQRKPME